MLLQHLWPAFLEKQVSALFARRVVVILQRLLQNKGSKVPLKYFSSIELQVRASRLRLLWTLRLTFIPT